jgi:uncharacterized protein YccT (UPF0319 family)
MIQLFRRLFGWMASSAADHETRLLDVQGITEVQRQKLEEELVQVTGDLERATKRVVDVQKSNASATKLAAVLYHQSCLQDVKESLEIKLGKRNNFTEQLHPIPPPE